MPQTNALQCDKRGYQKGKRLLLSFLMFLSVGGWYFYPVNEVWASTMYDITAGDKSYQMAQYNTAEYFITGSLLGTLNNVTFNISSSGSTQNVRVLVKESFSDYSATTTTVWTSNWYSVPAYSSAFDIMATSSGSDLIFDVGKDYRVQIQPDTNYNFNIYGSNSDPYANGAFQPANNNPLTNTGTKDAYLILSGTPYVSYYETDFTTFSPANASSTGTSVTFSQNYTMNSTSSPYDIIGIQAWYTSQNWNEIFNATTTMSAGANSFAMATTLQNNQNVNWRAYMYSSSTESTEIYLTDMHYFTVGVDPTPSMFGTTTENIWQLATSTCGITNLSGCFQNAIVWAFYPSQGSVAQLTGLKDEIMKKPPFGYFAVISTAFNSLSANGTPTFSLATSSPVMDNIFTPLRTGLSFILWILFGVWCLKTFSHFNI